MTNKTFKEEVENRFDQKFTETDGGKYLLIEPEEIKKFIESSLDLYKQKILEALPEDQILIQNEADGNGLWKLGWNKCLSEVKQIIENI